MSSDWPDYRDPFATDTPKPERTTKTSAKKGHRSTRPTSTWSITDLVYEYELEAQYNFPMRAARNNAKAIAGALGRLRTEIPDFSPELVVAMIDVFLADKRRVNPDIALWRQFIASWSRTVPEARRKLSVARSDRQGTSTADATAYLLDESDSVWTEEQVAAMSAKYLPLDEDGSAARAIDWSTPEED